MTIFWYFPFSLVPPLQVTGRIWGARELLRQYWSLPDHVVGFGEPSQGWSACMGDSGGPLICPNGSGSYDVIGVVSFGPGTCSGKPGVFTEVSQYRYVMNYRYMYSTYTVHADTWTGSKQQAISIEHGLTCRPSYANEQSDVKICMISLKHKHTFTNINSNTMLISIDSYPNHFPFLFPFLQRMAFPEVWRSYLNQSQLFFLIFLLFLLIRWGNKKVFFVTLPYFTGWPNVGFSFCMT